MSATQDNYSNYDCLGTRTQFYLLTLALHIMGEESRPLVPKGMILRSSIYKKKKAERRKQRHLPSAGTQKKSLQLVPTEGNWGRGWEQPGREIVAPFQGCGLRRQLQDESGHLPPWSLIRVGVRLPSSHHRVGKLILGPSSVCPPCQASHCPLPNS